MGNQASVSDSGQDIEKGACAAGSGCANGRGAGRVAERTEQAGTLSKALCSRRPAALIVVMMPAQLLHHFSHPVDEILLGYTASSVRIQLTPNRINPSSLEVARWIHGLESLLELALGNGSSAAGINGIEEVRHLLVGRHRCAGTRPNLRRSVEVGAGNIHAHLIHAGSTTAMVSSTLPWLTLVGFKIMFIYNVLHI